jgi:biopolymer transport protein ExbD
MRFTKSEDRRFAIEKVRLPLVALIDVVLFLLLYFMIAGSLSGAEAEQATALRSDKPGKGKGSNLVSQILYVEPGEGGVARFRLGDRVVKDKAGLPALLKQLPKEQGINVKVSPRVTVADVAAAQQACIEAGFAGRTYVPGK